MGKSKVYFTDFRAKLGEGLPSKLKRLIKAAGIGDIDMDNKFTAIKMHFGELGNISYLRPNYAKAVAEKEGCYKMMLLTGSKNEKTLEFYRNAGYNSADKTAFIQWIGM